MLRVGLLGLGMMGQVHRERYDRLAREGFPIRLAAICDIDERKWQGTAVEGNVAKTAGSGSVSGPSDCKLFTDIDKFLEEGLDIVDIALPTWLHDDMSIRAMNAGSHVLCEKPMALTTERGEAMLRTAAATGRKLMIAHCLRFWPEYVHLKDAVDDGRYGEVLAASFYREAGTPLWSYDDWLLNPEQSGGALLDLHIHDVDMINWLFGPPREVSAVATRVGSKRGHDIVSAHFLYADGKVIHAHADGALPGKVPFEMMYRVHFREATLVFEKGALTVYPEQGEAWSPEPHSEDGYYREIKYFAEAVLHDRAIRVSDPADTLRTMRIIEAERASAVRGGAMVALPAD